MSEVFLKKKKVECARSKMNVVFDPGKKVEKLRCLFVEEWKKEFRVCPW